MLKGILSDLKLHRDEFFMPLLIVSFCWLMGFGLCWAIMYTVSDPGSWVTFGTFTAFLALIIFVVLFFYKYHQEFMLALSMGRTRGEFMLSYAVRMLLWLLLGYGLLLILYRVELTLGKKLFSQWPLEIDPTFLLDLRFVAVVIPCGVLLSMFVGTLYSHFGKKALVPLWFLWVGTCLIGPNMLPDEETDPTQLQTIGLQLAAFVSKVPTALWIALAITLVAAMITTIVTLGKKQMVH